MLHGTIASMVTYRVHDTITEQSKEALHNYDALTQQLLFRRGIENQVQAEAFLNPSYNDDLHDPMLLHDMDKAVTRIYKAMQNKEKIAIFSDYDCDGIPGAVIVHDFFKAIGYEHFINYIPHRHYEGFGFSESAVVKLAEDAVQLIITIDCGTSDSNAVAKAKEFGIDVIITDHHEPKEVLPDAVAIVNPKVGDTYPFSGLCGAGVVFKLVQALIAQDTTLTLKPGWEKWWLDMVGIATIADMVPLTGENRALAHYGLQVLRKSRRPGLQHLLRKQGVNQRFLTEDDIGFTIGPRINAASRMDNPEDAFNLLATLDEAQAGAHVAHLEKLNNERKGFVASMVKESNKKMKETIELPNVLVLGNPNWRPSLVGLVANKLVEEYKRPAFLWGKDGNGQIKGSCRSDGTISVIALMDKACEALQEYGGHHMSGGFGVRDTHIHTLQQTLNEALASLGEQAFIADEHIVDASIALEAIDYAFLQAQQRLAPFGVDNPKPLYELKNVVPERVEVFGKTKEHTKLIFDTASIAKEAIAFFKLPEDFSVTPEEGTKLTLLAHLEQSYFMGRQQIRLRIVDIV